MRPGSVLSAVVHAVALGLAVTLLTAEARVVSLEIWLASALVFVMFLAGREAFRSVPGAADYAQPVLTRRRSTPSGDEPPRRPKGLRSMERLVAQSIEEPRSFAAQLQPRLQRIAEPLGGADRLPSSLRWMVEEPADRAPTLDELADFLDARSGAEQ